MIINAEIPNQYMLWNILPPLMENSMTEPGIDLLFNGQFFYHEKSNQISSNNIDFLNPFYKISNSCRIRRNDPT